MGAPEIHLLGKPFAVRDGRGLPAPRGRKAWALLAYLVCTGRAHSREHLAAFLFGDADDPLGALRWNIAEIRRALGADAIGGDPLRASPAASALADVRSIGSGSWTQALEFPGLGHELLEGMSFASAPAFEAWLLSERRHQLALAEAVLREAALAKLGLGDAEGAIGLGARLVALNPFEEGYQEVLIRAYAVAGDRVSAQRQLAACIDLYRRELGVEPGSSVFAAADAREGSTSSPAVSGRAAARAQLQAGRAAMDAGAIDAGVECLRRAILEAHAAGDVSLKAQCLVELGTALVHAVRGGDEEGAATLHEALALAAQVGDRALRAAAHRGLAWVEMLAARYERALRALDEAEGEAEAANDRGGEARAMFVRAHCLLEMSRYGDARAAFDATLQIADELGDRRMRAEILSEVARYHHIREEYPAMYAAASEALALGHETHLLTLRPYMEGMVAIAEVAAGRLDGAEERLQEAFAFACQLGDPCAEGFGAYALGLLDHARGKLGEAAARYEDARRRCTRRPDSSVWLQAFTLDAMCAIGVERGDPTVGRSIAELEMLAGRAGLRELLVRAYIHRARLGDVGALDVARTLGEQIDNPALARAISSAEAGVPGRAQHEAPVEVRLE